MPHVCRRYDACDYRMGADGKGRSAERVERGHRPGARSTLEGGIACQIPVPLLPPSIV
jgi:hypothetical protein